MLISCQQDLKLRSLISDSPRSSKEKIRLIRPFVVHHSTWPLKSYRKTLTLIKPISGQSELSYSNCSKVKHPSTLKIEQNSKRKLRLVTMDLARRSKKSWPSRLFCSLVSAFNMTKIPEKMSKILSITHTSSKPTTNSLNWAKFRSMPYLSNLQIPNRELILRLRSLVVPEKVISCSMPKIRHNSRGFRMLSGIQSRICCYRIKIQKKPLRTQELVDLTQPYSEKVNLMSKMPILLKTEIHLRNPDQNWGLIEWIRCLVDYLTGLEKQENT